MCSELPRLLVPRNAEMVVVKDLVHSLMKAMITKVKLADTQAKTTSRRPSAKMRSFDQMVEKELLNKISKGSMAGLRPQVRKPAVQDALVVMDLDSQLQTLCHTALRRPGRVLQPQDPIKGRTGLRGRLHPAWWSQADIDRAATCRHHLHSMAT